MADMDIEDSLSPVDLQVEKMEEEEDGEDEIIAEVPLLLNRDLAGQLYVAQYPLRSATRPYTHETVGDPSIRVKPTQRSLEIEHSLAHGLRDTDDMDEMERAKLHLTSNHIHAKTNYAVGVIRNGASFVHSPLYLSLSLSSSSLFSSLSLSRSLYLFLPSLCPCSVYL